MWNSIWLISSSGLGFSALQLVAWLKGIEVADHLTDSTHHLVLAHTVEFEDTISVAHDATRSAIWNLYFWSCVLMNILGLQAVLWIIYGREFTLTDLVGSKLFFILCGFLKEGNMAARSAWSVR